MGSVSSDKRVDGVPVRVGKLPGSAPVEENLAGANQARDEKLLVRRLERRARGGGYQLRHSDHGYSLIDAAHKPVDGRRDLSLKEFASLLDEALKR